MKYDIDDYIGKELIIKGSENDGIPEGKYFILKEGSRKNLVILKDRQDDSEHEVNIGYLEKQGIHKNSQHSISWTGNNVKLFEIEYYNPAEPDSEEDFQDFISIYAINKFEAQDKFRKKIRNPKIEIYSMGESSYKKGGMMHKLGGILNKTVSFKDFFK